MWLSSLLVLDIILVVRATDPDPCLESVYGTLDDLRRSINYDANPTETPLCDDQLKSGWYRFLGGAMPESCVPMNKCGTNMTIWLNGIHPTVEEGVAVKTLCFHAQSMKCIRFCGVSEWSEWPGWLVWWNAPEEWVLEDSCCSSTLATRVKNCTGFYVYHLDPVPSCPKAYCAGDAKICQSGQSGIEPFCKDIYPRLANVPNVTGPVIEGDDFYFFCEFTTIQNYSQPVFDVMWTVDNINLSNGSVTANNTSYKLKGSLLEGNLNKYVGCKVKSYFKDTPNTTSEWKESGNTYWAGIKMEPSSLVISEAEGEKNLSVVFTVPIVCSRYPTCPPIKLTLEQYGTAKGIVSVKCDYYVYSTDWDNITKSARINIPIKAKQDHIVNYGNRFNMVGFQPIIHIGVFMKATIASIPVYILDATERYCNIYGDPHIKGIEYNKSPYYHFYTVGDYTLYENKERYFEVQVRTFVCNRNAWGGIITCICAVMIREFNDIIRIDNCHYMVNKQCTIPPLSTIVRKFHPATVLLRSPDGMVYTIYLPSSTEVKVTQVSCSMTVDIIIPGTDKGKGRGICGTFDGILNNEFIYRDQVKQDTCARNDMGCNPVGFIESWRNEGVRSLFKATPGIVTDNRTQVYCTCFTKNVVSCTVRSDIPNKILNCPGCKMVNTTTRKRRSTDPPAFPPYDPDDYKDLMPANASWPTMSGITEQIAEEMCRNALQSSQLWALCNTNITLDSNFLESCKIDILLMDSHTAVEPFVNAFTTECQVKMATNPDNYIVNENGESVLNPDVQTAYASCSLECLKNGQCQQGQCVCDSNKMGSNCQLQKGVGPILHHFYGSTTNVTTTACNIHVQTCERIFINVSNFEYTENIGCKVHVLPLDEKPFPFYSTEGASFFSTNMVACALPVEIITPVRSNTTLKISVTMDGSLYSNELQLTVYNSTNGCSIIVHDTMYPTTVTALVLILVYYKGVFIEEIVNV